MRPEEFNIPKEKLQFKVQSGDIHDQKLDTKPVGFLKDAWTRFKKNKASIAASVIIILLILFAIFVPIFSHYRVSYSDDASYPIFKDALPKNRVTTALGLDFWDGCKENKINETKFLLQQAYAAETGHYAYKDGEYEVIVETNILTSANLYKIREDSYFTKGMVYKNLTPEEYQDIQDYQNETGIQVIYPTINKEVQGTEKIEQAEPNLWFKYKKVKNKITAIYDKNGEFIPNYVEVTKDANGNYSDDYNSIRIEGDEAKYSYAAIKDGGYRVRVSFYEYYCFYNTVYYDEGITEPVFLFGTTSAGQDILTCLASGARFSLILSVIVASVNLIVGAIIGALEGYYGGVVDLVVERVIDILGSIPFMIVITLLKHNFRNLSHLVILFISFFITGWTGMAARTRMQFYRYKNQEYVLVARTLGASDGRIMFKHIFPNAIGTLITGSVLVIPGVIFSETSLSYLGIINLESGNLISVGTLLGKGTSTTLITTPHVIIFPALFISLLMLSFNLFGNGLRDAFNPSLRGTEE